MNKRELLIVEDDISVARQIKWGLGSVYEISIAHDSSEAKKLLKNGSFAVTILDLGLPPNPDTTVEGFKLLQEISSISPQTKVIVITGSDHQEHAARAVGLGAADFYSKPIDLKLLKFILERFFKVQELEQLNRQMQRQSEEGGTFYGMLGISPVMVKLFKNIRKISSTDYPVLITGSSGTGKELAARAVHGLSSRSKQPLVIINCGAIPANLLESEFFGHEKGAFTGAVSRKLGRFQQADKGTLFLDEIGELPMDLQVKILRFIQEGTIERVGSDNTITLDTRIIAATNIDLEAAIQKGTFREDLYYRLNVVPMTMPDLIERSEDILFLAQTFLKKESKSLGRGQLSFVPSAIAAMTAHDWPGNVRELHNRIRRAIGTVTGRNISAADLGLKEQHELMSEERIMTLREARAAAEIKVIRKALEIQDNNISQAAQLLEVSRPTLHDLLKKHGIET